MLKRHCALIPGASYNLPAGDLVDFLLAKGIAIILIPPPLAGAVSAGPSETTVAGPSEFKDETEPKKKARKK